MATKMTKLELVQLLEKRNNELIALRHRNSQLEADKARLMQAYDALNKHANSHLSPTSMRARMLAAREEAIRTGRCIKV